MLNWDYFSQFTPLVVSFIAYAILHSVLAATFAKTFLEKLLPNYRLFFNAIAVITLFGPLYFYLKLTPNLLIDMEFLKIPGFLITVYGVWVMKQSFKNYSLAHFLGLANNSNTIASKLIIDGWNKKVRHPLYFGSLLAIWGWFLVSPTDKYLILSVIFTLYFVIGLRFEESRLVKEFGEDYKKYQLQVPALFPTLKLFSVMVLALPFAFSCTNQSEDQSETSKPFAKPQSVIFLTTFNPIPESQKFDSMGLFQKINPKVELVQIAIDSTLIQHYGFEDFSITENSFQGKSSFKSLFFKTLDNRIEAALFDVSENLENPNLIFEKYQSTQKQMVERYQKTFLVKDTSAELLLNAKLLAYQWQASQQLLSNWQPDSTIINQPKLFQSFIKAVNKLHPSFIYDEVIFNALNSAFSISDSTDTNAFELLNNKIEQVHQWELNPVQKRNLQFRLLVNYIQQNNQLEYPIENSFNYRFLGHPDYYKKLQAIQQNVTKAKIQTTSLPNDSIGSDSLTPIQ